MVRGADGADELLTFRLVKQHGEQGRGVDDHQLGSPCSS
jgi:hypothetical protein